MQSNYTDVQRRHAFRCPVEGCGGEVINGRAVQRAMTPHFEHYHPRYKKEGIVCTFKLQASAKRWLYFQYPPMEGRGKKKPVMVSREGESGAGDLGKEGDRIAGSSADRKSEPVAEEDTGVHLPELELSKRGRRQPEDRGVLALKVNQEGETKVVQACAWKAKVVPPPRPEPQQGEAEVDEIEETAGYHSGLLKDQET